MYHFTGFLPAGVGGRFQHRYPPMRQVRITKINVYTSMLIPTFSRTCWIKITTIAATNQTIRETIVDTSTDRPFDHFLGSLGGSTFQKGIKHTLVAKTPKTQASPELTRSVTLFELSDKIMKIAGIIVEGTVPSTLPTAPPYFSIRKATAIAIKKATDAERVGFRKFVLYFFI